MNDEVDSKPEWYDWASDERKTGEIIRDEDPEWFAQICQILFDNDPMLIRLVHEPDGFVPEAGSIIRSLPQCINAEDVQQLVFNVFTQWFTPEFAGERCQYTDTASAIWASWKARQQED